MPTTVAALPATLDSKELIEEWAEIFVDVNTPEINNVESHEIKNINSNFKKPLQKFPITKKLLKSSAHAEKLRYICSTFTAWKIDVVEWSSRIKWIN